MVLKIKWHSKTSKSHVWRHFYDV